MRHKPIPVLSRRIFNILDMRHVCLCGLSCRFQQFIPLTGAGCLCLTHPFATQCRSIASDLHVLGTPPAFILSRIKLSIVLFYLQTISCLLDSFFFPIFIDVFTVQFSMSLCPLVECSSIIPSILYLCKSFFYFFSFFCFLMV